MHLGGRRGDMLRSGEMLNSHDTHTHTLGRLTTNFAGDIVSGLMTGLLDRAPHNVVTQVASGKEMLAVGRLLHNCAGLQRCGPRGAQQRSARTDARRQRLELYW